MISEDKVYRYAASNGLYLVFFGDDAYIIDTGSPVSFTFKDGRRMDLATLPFELPGNLLGIKKTNYNKARRILISCCRP